MLDFTKMRVVFGNQDGMQCVHIEYDVCEEPGFEWTEPSYRIMSRRYIIKEDYSIKVPIMVSKLIKDVMAELERQKERVKDD
jgi:hypothetical protein